MSFVKPDLLPQPPPHDVADPNAPNVYAGLDLIVTAILIVDRNFQLMYANAAAENLFAFSRKTAMGVPLQRLMSDSGGDDGLFGMLSQVMESDAGFNESSLTVHLPGGAVRNCSCVATPSDSGRVVVEFQPLDQHIKIAREEQILEQQKRNRELIRNLAHEIKNPLGGIRGAAQLLERELPDESLAEYTQVIVKEADRLQSLMDRLLTPHRLPKIEPTNIHEVLEHVRAVVMAEFPTTLSLRRDYDISLPDLLGDREQLIQAMLNITRNAAQAMNGAGRIMLSTRIARQVTIARERHRLAIEVRVIDSGPGVPAHLKETIFYPLVTGRDGGTGVGLSIAQNFINQHAGVIEFESVPGRTEFIVLLPIRANVTPRVPQ